MTPPLKRLDFTLRKANLLALLVLIVAGASAMAWSAWRGGTWFGPPCADERRAESADLKIDPNTANVPSLMRMPRIGRTLAQEIVNYRLAHPPRPFVKPADLQAVPRIGPATVQYLLPYLALDVEAVRDDSPWHDGLDEP